MVFKTNQKKWLKYNNQNNDQQIEQVEHKKLLGLYIDNGLSWKYHIDQVRTNISRRTGIMTKARHYISLQT